MPFVVKVPLSNSWGYVDLRYYTQKAPYRAPLEMESMRRHFSTQVKGEVNRAPANNAPAYPASWTGAEGRAAEIAYRRLIQQLGDAAQIGSTVTTEARSSYGLVVGSLVKLATAARHVKALRLGAAATTLGIPVVRRDVTIYQRNRKGYRKAARIRRTYFDLPDGRTVSKTAAGGWLLWSYGASPLMDDISTAMKHLTSPLPWHRIYGSGVFHSYRKYGSGLDFDDMRLVDSVSQAVFVRVSNPNLYLAARLGLVNPLQMGLEGIPFSFVLDWFSNLSEVISSMTDFVGLDVQQPILNRSIKGVEFSSRYNGYWSPPYNVTRRDSTWRYRFMRLQPPVLRFAYERFQWQRGLNAISLLVGFLPSTKR